MNAAVYDESYELPAGLLAVVVHGAFFALLYFGFAWQSQKPATMSVDLWQSLPDEVAAPVVQAQPVVPPAPVVQPVPVVQHVPEVKPAPKEETVQAEVKVKPDIVMPTKKPVPKPVKAKPAHPVEPKKAEVQPQAKPAEPGPSELAVARLQAEQATQAAHAAAVQGVIDEYKTKIQNKIRPNIVGNLSDVPDDARVEFSVTVLPGGSVLPPRKIKTSGYANYDDAVERAILKSQPLPLPPDADIASKFRDLNLGFQPKEPKE